MGSAKFFLPLTLLLSSWVFLGYSQFEALMAGLGGGGGGAGAGGIACAQKLLPCQAYLKPPSSPPDSCCSPLKQMIAEDKKCLCGIFNNQDLLKSFQVTQDEALKLLDKCDVKADISECDNAAGGGSGGATTPPDASNSTSPPSSSNLTEPASNSTTAPTSSPTTPAADAPSSGSADANSTTTKSSASHMSLLGGYGFVALFASLFI